MESNSSIEQVISFPTRTLNSSYDLYSNEKSRFGKMEKIDHRHGDRAMAPVRKRGDCQSFYDGASIREKKAYKKAFFGKRSRDLLLTHQNYD